MKCYNCNQEMVKKYDYHLYDEYIGNHIINCEYYQCEYCKDELLPIQSLQQIELFEKTIIKELLLKNFHPSTAVYLTIDEVATLENTTVEYILNDKKFNLWVYHIVFNNEILYLKDSYLKHKETGNIGFVKLIKE